MRTLPVTPGSEKLITIARGRLIGVIFKCGLVRTVRSRILRQPAPKCRPTKLGLVTLGGL